MVSSYRERLLQPSKQSFFVFGPRGTGKSTWLMHEFPKAHRIDLLDEERYQTFLANPSAFADLLRTHSKNDWVIVDEIQRLPNLLNEVHRAIENQKLRFVLSGSSARKLRRAGTNLLAGRALTKHLHPYLPAELGDAFDLENTLQFGTLPVVFDAEEKKQSLQAYVQTYLREEIQSEALVRNLPGFARFLPIGALFHAQTLNLANVSREAEIARSTAQGYLEILQDTLLAFTLPAYEARLRVRERKHPKLYWVDPGVVRAIKKDLSDVHADERGSLFEGFVAQCLRAYGDYDELFDEWFYWAPSEAAETEVDFLLKRSRQFLAIEVKAARKLHKKSFKGLKAIEGLSGLVRRLVVYMGVERLRTQDGIDVLPVKDFFREIENGRLWP